MTQLVTFDQLVEQCNDLIWRHMHSPPYRLKPGSYQHRDMVRAFMAGALEAYMLLDECGQDQYSQVASLLHEYDNIMASGWCPGKRYAPPGPETN